MTIKKSKKQYRKIDYLFQIFEAHEYFTTDEISDAIKTVVGLVASGRKMNNENTEVN